MDRTIKKDVERRYSKMCEQFSGKSEEISCYVCEQCGQVTKVRQIDEGMPMGGIECPHCHGQAGLVLVDTYPNIPVTHEWYRPALCEVLEMVEDNRIFTVNLVLNGGLLRREINLNK